MSKLMLGWMLAGVAWAAGWESVQRISPEQRLEVVTPAATVKGTFVSASDSAVVVLTKAGEQSLPKADVRRVRVSDPSRRIQNGLLGTAIGLGAGIGIGFAVCPSCSNEGHGGKYVGPAAAAGAGIGALAFLPAPFTTIYRGK